MPGQPFCVTRMKLRAGRSCIEGILLAWLLAGSAQAADLIQVKDPWTRATVPGQKVGGVYMKLIAREPLRLTGVRTKMAETAELHQMKMEEGMMRMRPLQFLDLPARKTVMLAPGGNHIMLFDLKQSLVAGQKIRLELVVQDASKRERRVVVEAIVRDRASGPQPEHDQR